MIKKKYSVLGILPARSGSKGLKNKNIKILNNKPLFFYAAKALVDSKLIDKKICSTDSIKIAKLAKEYGLEIDNLRPKYLATDKAIIVDVLNYELKKMASKNEFYDYIVLVQPTSPTITTNLINKAVKLAISRKLDNVITGYYCNMQHPSTFYTFDKKKNFQWLIKDKNRKARRQDMKKYFIRTGLLYVIKSQLIYNKNFYGKKIGHIEIKKENSITIDDKYDFLQAKKIFEK